MRNVRISLDGCIRTGLLWGMLAAASGLASFAHADDDLRFQQRRNQAKAALESRMNSRFAAGWAPKSKDEQMVTRLGALRRMMELKQDRLNTRAAFESARAEVYLDLVRHYTTIGYYRRGYTHTYTQDRLTGVLRPVVHYDDYWVLDPWAARLSAHFGSKAARSKGIAAAHEYHANTHYGRRVRNTNARIDALQRQIKLKSQLAGKAP